LLKLKSRKRQWVAYHGAERVVIGRTDSDVYQSCLRRGLQRGEFYVASIGERDTPPWAVEPIERFLYEASDELPPPSRGLGVRNRFASATGKRFRTPTCPGEVPRQAAVVAVLVTMRSGTVPASERSKTPVRPRSA
jgi:hypothetical protein